MRTLPSSKNWSARASTNGSGKMAVPAMVLLAAGGLVLLLNPGVANAALLSGISETNMVMFASLLLSSACTWIVAHKVYRRRILARTKALSARMADEISFRDMAIERHCIVAVTDPDGRFMKVNDKFMAAFGYDRDDVIGKGADILYPDESEAGGDAQNADGVVQYHAICHMIQENRPWSGEQILRTADGQPIVVASTIIPQVDDAGRHLCTVCLLTDITEQKLSGVRRQLGNVLDDLQDEVFIFEVDSLAVTYMNKSALVRFGWTEESAKGKRIADTDPDFDVALFRRHTAPLFNGSRDFVEIQARHGNTDVEIVTRLHRDASGRRVFLSVLRDITGRKRIEKVKMETVARVSHELRTPLTSIKGALGLLLSGSVGDLPDNMLHLLDIAHSNNDHLLTMVNDILDLERMNAGRMTLEKRPENLLDIVDETRNLNLTFREDAGLTTRLCADTDQYPVACDRSRIAQIVINLLSNAAKFSPRNGVIEIALTRHDNVVRVSVRDHGPGIPVREQGKLFRDFAQVASGDGKTRAGTGLGLAICKKLVTMHGGNIGLTSTEGKGTTVYFELPLLVAGRDAESAPQPAAILAAPDADTIQRAG